MRALLLALAALVALGLPGLAVQPGEMLADPALEARAREISRELRCPVCRNENIDDSNADIARDLRLIVRERLVAGDSDADVVAYVVARYGDFVLLRPRFSAFNLVLWGAGPVLLLAGFLILLRWLRRPAAAVAALDAEEEARLAALLKREGGT